MFEDGSVLRYKRRQQLEEEAWNRLKGSEGVSDFQHNNNGPWSRAAIIPESLTTIKKSDDIKTNVKICKNEEKFKENITETKEKNQPLKVKKKEPLKNASNSSKITNQKEQEVAKKSFNKLDSSKKTIEPTKKGSKKELLEQATTSTVSKNSGAEESRLKKNHQLVKEQQAEENATLMTHRKPPLPRQNSSQEDLLLNDKIETIRLAHEKRIKDRVPPNNAQNDNSEVTQESEQEEEVEEEEVEETIEKLITKKAGRQKFRILYRSASSHPPITQKIIPGRVSTPQTKLSKEKDQSKNNVLRIIPIAHYPGNNESKQFERSKTNPNLAKQISTEQVEKPRNSNNNLLLKNLENSTIQRNSSNTVNSPQLSPSSTKPTNSEPQNADGETRRSRFRRRSSVSDKETPREPSSSVSRPPPTPTICSSRRLSRSGSDTKRTIIPPAIDYISKYRPRLTFGRKGTYKSEFHWPRGIAPMPGGEFAVADSSNHRIQIFDKNGKRRFFLNIFIWNKSACLYHKYTMIIIN